MAGTRRSKTAPANPSPPPVRRRSKRLAQDDDDNAGESSSKRAKTAHTEQTSGVEEPTPASLDEVEDDSYLYAGVDEPWSDEESVDGDVIDEADSVAEDSGEDSDVENRGPRARRGKKKVSTAEPKKKKKVSTAASTKSAEEVEQRKKGRAAKLQKFLEDNGLTALVPNPGIKMARDCFSLEWYENLDLGHSKDTMFAKAWVKDYDFYRSRFESALRNALEGRQKMANGLLPDSEKFPFAPSQRAQLKKMDVDEMFDCIMSRMPYNTCAAMGFSSVSTEADLFCFGGFKEEDLTKWFVYVGFIVVDHYVIGDYIGSSHDQHGGGHRIGTYEQLLRYALCGLFNHAGTGAFPLALLKAFLEHGKNFRLVIRPVAVWDLPSKEQEDSVVAQVLMTEGIMGDLRKTVQSLDVLVRIADKMVVFNTPDAARLSEQFGSEYLTKSYSGLNKVSPFSQGFTSVSPALAGKANGMYLKKVKRIGDGNTECPICDSDLLELGGRASIGANPLNVDWCPEQWLCQDCIQRVKRSLDRWESLGSIEKARQAYQKLKEIGRDAVLSDRFIAGLEEASKCALCWLPYESTDGYTGMACAGLRADTVAKLFFVQVLDKKDQHLHYTCKSKIEKFLRTSQHPRNSTSYRDRMDHAREALKTASLSEARALFPDLKCAEEEEERVIANSSDPSEPVSEL
ncbi:hypothetical protein LTR17_027087 [Elasticomyces elasticus]|nr:hypothetical protein LTR17_027087 [Elasticomyces elasticus]